ncbi:vacuolar protein 8-like isoform X3 [Alligator sinensis]|uniref:Vacuolar protein 8 n=1 Tax=Alligator sinensis TaxID=38654 RepID=A0A3Q0HB25_ALLSI|nr:vacuolar protein 8-like isoform X3 [Alligator sinensis]
MSLLGKNSLEALRTLAFSENPGLQQSAALYYLHLSQHLISQLTEEHLEPYYALLQSSDVEVQQMSSLSLVNFLLEGNINRDLVVQMGLLEPILELLELGDSTVQCNSCACIMTLAASEWIQQVLCREGALPVLTLLLESPDSEVQYYSCTALSNLAVNSHHHEAMLRTGEGFLLRTLISLLSSSVEKVSSQACVCLRNLAVSVHIQADIIAMDVLPQLLSLLASSSTDVQQASIALLWKLSQHPGNQDTLTCAEMLNTLGKLLLTHKADPVLVGHAACIIKNLILPQNMQRIMESSCSEGLLYTILSPDVQEEPLHYVIACLAELAKHEGSAFHMLQWMDESLIKCLVKLAGQLQHTEPSFQAASIIQHVICHEKVRSLLKCHIKEIQCYLMNFLTHQEIRFQQLGISTVCKLQEDPEFSLAIRQSQLMEHLERVHQQTEETQKLLRVVINHMDI